MHEAIDPIHHSCTLMLSLLDGTFIRTSGELTKDCFSLSAWYRARCSAIPIQMIMPLRIKPLMQAAVISATLI